MKAYSLITPKIVPGPFMPNMKDNDAIWVILGPHNWTVTEIFEEGPQIWCIQRTS